MRKRYFLFLAFIFGVLTVTAQVNFQKNTPIQINHPHRVFDKPVNNKTVVCHDTVYYPDSKLTGLVEVDTMQITTYIGAVSQTYYYSGSGSILALNAYVLLDLDGIPGNVTPITMIIKVYNVDAQNMPTTLIDSAIVPVADVGFQAQTLGFNAAVAVSDTFAVSIEVNPAAPANPYYVTNTSANQDGNAEGLSCFNYAGTWFNAYITYGSGWNMDMMLSPVILQNFTSSFTTDKDTICTNDVVVFTNTAVNTEDPMFNTFNTSTKPLYTWDFNDGSGTYNPFDTTYTFTQAGSYNTQLTTNYYGYTTNCMDSSQQLIMVYDTAVANFGVGALGGGSYQFTDSTSATVLTWLWDFGDGSPVDNTQNPTHVYASPGDYQVCLTVSNGCNSDMICDSVSFVVGIDDFYASDYVKVYPIPANKQFNVSVPSNYFGGTIIITDVVGQQLKLVEIERQEKINVSTEGISSGIYFVSVDYGGERVFTKRIVIDK